MLENQYQRHLKSRNTKRSLKNAITFPRRASDQLNIRDGTVTRHTHICTHIHIQTHTSTHTQMHTQCTHTYTQAL